MTRRVAFLALVLAVVAPAWAAEPESINDKVVKFCKAKLGKPVGDGKCAALATEALKAAGAKTLRAFKDHPNDSDYVWGEPVYLLEVKDGKRTVEAAKGQKVKPGDVVQFRDAKFSGRNAVGFYMTSSPHHTAVVVAVQNGGRTLVVLHQNSNGKKLVTQQAYQLADLREGWVRVYRPVAAE